MNPSVQAQNAKKLLATVSHARTFRENPDIAPPLVLEFLTSHGVDPTTDLVLYDDMSGYEDCNAHGGTIYTSAGHFYEFEMDLNDGGTDVEYSSYNCVDAKFPIDKHVPGIGVSTGYIYQQALQTLNEQTPDG